MKKGYMAVDIETTGLNCEKASIIEIGAAVIIDGKETARFIGLIHQDCELPERIVNLTGITDEMLKEASTEQEVMNRFLDFYEKEMGMLDEPNCILGHNVMFDYSFLKIAALRINRSFECKGIDTLYLSRTLNSEYESKTLEAMCKAYHIERTVSHRAYEDAIAASHLFECMKHKFYETDKKEFEFRPLVYKPKKQEPMTAKQQRYLIDLCQAHGLDLPKELDLFTKSKASRFIDHTILKFGMISRK